MFASGAHPAPNPSHFINRRPHRRALLESARNLPKPALLLDRARARVRRGFSPYRAISRGQL